MTTETMNVHKALCELKTLDDRIEKTYNRRFVFSNKHSNTKVGGISIADYCAEIQSDYQKVKDLIARRDAIKRAVVLSNATTKITIAGDEYTVAEAIELKNHSIPLRKNLLAKLTADNRLARAEADNNNGNRLEACADKYIEAMLGAGTDLKNLSEEAKRMRADYVTAHTVEVIDPIKVTEEMQRLESEITAFEVEVDSMLSVSNALTEITVEY